MTRRTIAGNLQAFERRDSPLSLTPAAVAIVLVMSDGIPSVPIFQRPLNMSRHAGQIALPGGKVHAGETVEDCAIREVNEELGLVLDTVDVLGLLDDFDTESGFRITPVVIWSSAGVSDLKPSNWEVLKLFVIGTPELHDTVAAAALGSTQEFS